MAGVRTRWALRSFLTFVILWFYKSFTPRVFEVWNPKMRDSISLIEAETWLTMKLQNCFLIRLETMSEENRKDGTWGRVSQIHAVWPLEVIWSNFMGFTFSALGAASRREVASWRNNSSRAQDTEFMLWKPKHSGWFTHATPSLLSSVDWWAGWCIPTCRSWANLKIVLKVITVLLFTPKFLNAD